MTGIIVTLPEQYTISESTAGNGRVRSKGVGKDQAFRTVIMELVNSKALADKVDKYSRKGSFPDYFEVESHQEHSYPGTFDRGHFKLFVFKDVHEEMIDPKSGETLYDTKTLNVDPNEGFSVLMNAKTQSGKPLQILLSGCPHIVNVIRTNFPEKFQVTSQCILGSLGDDAADDYDHNIRDIVSAMITDNKDKIEDHFANCQDQGVMSALTLVSDGNLRYPRTDDLGKYTLKIEASSGSVIEQTITVTDSGFCANIDAEVEVGVALGGVPLKLTLQGERKQTLKGSESRVRPERRFRNRDRVLKVFGGVKKYSK